MLKCFKRNEMHLWLEKWAKVRSFDLIGGLLRINDISMSDTFKTFLIQKFEQ